LIGGKALTRGRGEILEPLDFEQMSINLIKPLNLGISAKEAYTKFSNKRKTHIDTEGFKNDLEWAVIDDYYQLKYIKAKYPTSMMTGSGSTYFSISEQFQQENGYWVKNGLKTIPNGVKVAD
jgi:4-diphosphocytidyl-2C-methyl-D-erythritol kinase